MPTRLAWLAFHLTVIAAGIVALAHGWGGLWAAPLYALVIGHAFAGCAFVGHETMHGAVVRGRRLRYLVGFVSFLPFTLSPRLWVAWHNKTHHGNTMSETDDPDAYPTLEAYRRSGTLRFVDRFSFARDRWAGIVTLLVGFTGQSSQMLWRWSRKGGLETREHRLAVAETLGGLVLWASIGFVVGPLAFLFAFVLPLLVANAIVIGYILTNHSLSPMTEVNDPLVNSLSVTVPRWVARMHLEFGLHVEHHLFPSMSSAYAPLVRAEQQARWPERYQSMPLLRALLLLRRTPRVYRTPTKLHDPLTGHEATTLLPGAAPPAEPPAPSKNGDALAIPVAAQVSG